MNQDVISRKLQRNLEEWIEEFERNSTVLACPFSDKEKTPKARKARIEKAMSDFWFFDKTYFPPEAYSQGYSKPGKFHKELVELVQTPGVANIAASRKIGKTVTVRKLLVWLLLSGNVRFAIVASEKLPTAYQWLRFVEYNLLRGRVAEDFKPEIVESSKDALIFKTNRRPGLKVLKPASTGTSVRGQSEDMERPELVIVDDMETSKSSFTRESVQKRELWVSEAFDSLDDNYQSLTILSNNLDPRCLTNTWLKQQKQGILSEHYRVHIFPAWSKGKSLWPGRYPAKSEAEMKALLKPMNENNWQSDFQQNPVPPDGFVFKREYYKEFDKLPGDAQGIIYCDPNLAKKGKGDTAAIISLFWSPSTQQYYVWNMRCRSFSKTADLLIAVIQSYRPGIILIGFDGWVNQESHWTEHLNNFKFIAKDTRFQNAASMLESLVEWKRYKVNDLTFPAQMAWEQGKINFPVGFSDTDEGQTALAQIFAFAGKDANNRDDAPDALICAIQMLTELNMIYSGKLDYTVTKVKPYYQL